MKARKLILISIFVLVTPMLFAAYGPQQGTPQAGTSGGNLMSLIFMLFVWPIPAIFICRRLAKEKGRNITRFTVLAIIPIVNLYAIPHIIGASNKHLENKIDAVLSLLAKEQEQTPEKST